MVSADRRRLRGSRSVEAVRLVPKRAGLLPPRDGRMEDDASARFRERARECRALAGRATTDEWRESLLSLARDLENEADRPDAEADGD